MSIARKFFTVSGITVISRIFGGIREVGLSHFLGACAEMDAFLIAFKFPAFFRRCFAEGGFQSIFVPYLTDFTAIGKLKGAKYFSSRIFTLIFWVMLFFTILVFIFAKEFVLIMAPGFASTPEKFALATEFTRIIFPSITFVSLSAVYSSILISNKKFALFSLSPIIVNLVLISSLFICQDIATAGRRLSYGVLAGGIFQFIFLYTCVKLKKLTIPRISKVRRSPKMKDFLKKLIPVLVGAGVAQINIFMDIFFGSFLPTGGITYIYFADRFIQFPLALFGISMATILLPEISSCISKGKSNEIKETQNKALLFTLRLTLPSVVGLIALSYVLISAMYGHGKFSESSVQRTADVLKFFAIGIPAYVASKILSSILFAQKDSKTPVKAAIISIITNLILSGILIIPLKEIGIAIATTASGFINVYIMYKNSKTLFSIDKTLITALLKILAASLTMFIIITILKNIITINHNNVFSEIIFLAIACFIACAIYVLTLYLLKDTAVTSIIGIFKKKFSKPLKI